MSGENVLHPLVYWAQTDNSVSLRVDITDVISHSIAVTPENLTFEAKGIGSGGLHTYKFTLDFYGHVIDKKSAYRVTDRNIEINLIKAAEVDPWERLTYKKQKPAWLRLDFDKFKIDDDSDNEEDEKKQQKEFHKEQLKCIEKEIEEAHKKVFTDIKTIYLFLYNLLQFLGYMYIFIILFSRFIFYGRDDMEVTFQKSFYPLCICQFFAFLEIVHPLVGLVKTGLQATVMQVMGRNFLLFMVIAIDVKLQQEAIVSYMFMIWSAIEVVRYPYYIFAIVDYDSEVITWLRYTLWMPLYPLGLASEGIVTYLAIPYFKESGMFSWQLPNLFNIAFRFDYYLYTHLAILALSAPVLLSHMWKQRQKRLAIKSKVKGH